VFDTDSDVKFFGVKTMATRPTQKGSLLLKDMGMRFDGGQFSHAP
jgi:ribosomal protein L27